MATHKFVPLFLSDISVCCISAALKLYKENKASVFYLFFLLGSSLVVYIFLNYRGSKFFAAQ